VIIVTEAKIVSELLALPSKRRAEITGILLRSLDGEEDADEVEWATEIERRVQEIRRGDVKTIPGDLVMKRLRAKVRGSRARARR
jgi:putative addiction module component (TIGR02574 family)